MMNMIDTLMVLVFPFLDVIPFALPRYWMFRHKLRMPYPYVAALIFTVAAINSVAFYYINLAGPVVTAHWTTIMRYTFVLINMAFSFLLIKESFQKLMFTYLLLFAWSFFIFGNANYVESRFFMDFSDQHPYLVYNIARVLIYLVTSPFLFHFFYHTVADSLKINDEKVWRYLWKIPLFSALFGMLYCTTDDVYAFATWQFLVSRYLMLLGACYVSYIALRILEISNSRTQLEESLKYADLNLMSQKKQYDSLAAHMEEMAKVRHNLRQHLAAVQSYIDRDDKTGLSEYLQIFKDELPPDVMELFCRNHVVNAVICYYAAIARDNKIRFEANVDYPADCLITGTDITVLLGNLLENAVEACKRETPAQKYVKLRIKQRGNTSLLILIDNPCPTPVTFCNGIPLSVKGEGPGIGAASVMEIAARYNGAVQFKQEDGVFYSSVLLKLPQGHVE